jgi:RNA 2',3'-cyclic 3'-phosphodiesterase
MSTADASPNQASAAATSAPTVRPARVFIGLKVTPEITRELTQIAAGLKEPSVRLLAPADIHLTLVPPWA